MNYNMIQQMLENNICLVTFTKVDGTTRKMYCTLMKKYLPEDTRQNSGSMLTEGDGDQERISVFDTEVNEWRSFRISSVRDIQVASKLL